MDHVLPEISFAEAASDVRFFEQKAPVCLSTPIDLRLGFEDTIAHSRFAAVLNSADVQNFALEDVYLDTPCSVLIKNGRKIVGTRYLLSQERYDNVRILTENLIRLDERYTYVLTKPVVNWYHWLTQTLPTVDHSLRSGPADAFRVLLPPTSRAWQEESLDLLGLDGRQRAEMRPKHHYHLARAQYSEFVNGRTAFKVSFAARETFQRLAHAALGPPPFSARAIYVARTDTTNRVLANEADLIDALAGLDVVPVIPGSLTVAEQINLFANADLVIGAHGAGMSNIAFCKPGTVVYELHASHYLNPCMNRLAQAADLAYAADVFPGDASGLPQQQSWMVDVNHVVGRIRGFHHIVRTGFPRSPRPPNAALSVQQPEVPDRSDIAVAASGVGTVVRTPLIIPTDMRSLPSVHRSPIQQAVRLTCRPDDLRPGTRFLFICFTNRSGSNYLCSLLASTTHFHRAEEAFIGTTVQAVCRRQGFTTFGQYFSHLIETKAKNDIVAVKVAADQLVLLADTGILDAIAGRSQFIWVRRADRLRQAISLAIAGQNQKWTSFARVEMPDEALTYGAQEIAASMNWISEQENSFGRFFGVNGIEPVVADYDWFCRYPQLMVNEIGRSLGTPRMNIAPGAIGFEKQANEINEQWRMRFLAEPASVL